MQKTAAFSEDRRYRYLLTRIWDRDRPLVAFIGLNPSTADEVQDDPTVRRCIGYARDWDYGGLLMLNLLAYRSTDPRKLLKQPVGEVQGEGNTAAMINAWQQADLVVAAWGAWGSRFLDRTRELLRIFSLQSKHQHLYCLGMTKDGQPKHPLYLPKSATPVVYGRYP